MASHNVTNGQWYSFTVNHLSEGKQLSDTISRINQIYKHKFEIHGLINSILRFSFLVIKYVSGSLVRPKVVRSVHYCPATKKVLERRYTDLTSFDAFPSSSVYPTKVPLMCKLICVFFIFYSAITKDSDCCKA